MLVIQAKDDLSGVRSISGTILAPSGAVQGFACQREGSSDRFLARVVVPKDAAEGTWVVNYISLLDNASNANALSLDARPKKKSTTAMIKPAGHGR